MAIEAAIRHNQEAIQNDDYHLSDIVCIAESSELPVCLYRFDWTGIIGGEPTSGSGRGTSVLAQRGDAWVVVHEHLSRGATQ
jgi:ketosteroid isomerase-like protein